MRLLIVLAAALQLCAESASSLEAVLKDKLIERIRSIDQSLNGVLGFAAIDLESGQIFGHRVDSVFAQASSIKIPIMVEVFRAARDGRLKLTDEITLTSKDAVGGSGHLQLTLRSRPHTLSVEELVVAMIQTSDNTATNRLIALVGRENVNARMEKLGFHNTRLGRIMLDAEAAARNEENVSTPAEMARLAELIYRGKAIDSDASRRMIEVLKLVSADFRAAVPPNVPVASKPGAVTGVRCETGIVFVPGRPFALSVMSTFLDDGANPVREVTRLVYEHFAKLSRSNKFGNGGVR